LGYHSCGGVDICFRSRCRLSDDRNTETRVRNHPKVARVLYPGLPGFPQHDLARSQMSGFGGILETI
jgi:O-acetylhomoserine/O-acetylserine sulfhydrylase-like pyridoxal-dependent enzyme